MNKDLYLALPVEKDILESRIKHAIKNRRPELRRGTAASEEQFLRSLISITEVGGVYTKSRYASNYEGFILLVDGITERSSYYPVGYLEEVFKV